MTTGVILMTYGAPASDEDVAAYLAGVPIRVVTDPADCPPMAPQ